MQFLLGAIALLLTGLTAEKSATDPSGTWRWEHRDPGTQKTVKDVLKIKYENGKITGTYQGGDDVHKIAKTKIEGDTLSWEFNLDIDGNPLNIAFSGKISGDEIKGEVALGDFGKFPWTAKRDPRAADPSGTWRWEHRDRATQKMVKDVLKIKYENGKVTGTYQGGDDVHKIKNAKVEGDALSWEFNVDIGGNSLKVAFSGKISGDDIEGEVALGDFGKFPWTAKRDARSTETPPKVEPPSVADLLRDLNVPDVLAKSIEEWSNLPPHVRKTVELLLQGELKKLESSKKRGK